MVLLLEVIITATTATTATATKTPTITITVTPAMFHLLEVAMFQRPRKRRATHGKFSHLQLAVHKRGSIMTRPASLIAMG